MRNTERAIIMFIIFIHTTKCKGAEHPLGVLILLSKNARIIPIA